MRGLAVVLVVSLALSGCFGGDDDPEPSTSTTTEEHRRPGTTGTTATTTTTAPPGPTEYPLLLSFGLEGCDGTRAIQAMDAEAAAALLPDGFTPATSSATGVDPGQAAVGVEALRCDMFLAAGNEYPDVWFGRAFVVIEAPTDLYPDRDLSADVHEYVFQILAGEDILAGLWPVAGYDTHNGTGDHKVTDGVVLASSTTILGDYSLSAEGVAAAAGLSGSFSWYTVLEGGDTLHWNGTRDLPSSHQGSGTADVPSGSPLAGLGPLLGDDQLRGEGAIVAGGTWTDMDLVRWRAL